MSVYSYIEVYKPGEADREDNPHVGFGHGIHWTYQIAVAKGKHIYKGAEFSGDKSLHQFEERTAISIYELPINKALVNYQTVFQAMYALFDLKADYRINEKFYNDVGILVLAKHWFEQARQKIPNGVVKLDWCEGVFGASEQYVANWDLPNDCYKHFVSLGRDCNRVFEGKLSPKELSARYPEYLEYCGAFAPIEEPF